MFYNHKHFFLNVSWLSVLTRLVREVPPFHVMSVKMAAPWGLHWVGTCKGLAPLHGWQVGCQLLTRCSTAIIDQSVRILLHMAFACGWGFSQRGSFSKKKEAEAARPVKTWTQKFQNITFTVSNFSELSVIGQLQLMGKKIVWPSLSVSR